MVLLRFPPSAGLRQPEREGEVTWPILISIGKSALLFLFVSFAAFFVALAVSRKINKALMYEMEERNRVAEKLEKSEEQYRLASVYNRNLIEVSLDPLVTIDAEGRISDVNAATETITGYTRDRLIGTDFSDYFIEPEKAREGYLE